MQDAPEMNGDGGNDGGRLRTSGSVPESPARARIAGIGIDDLTLRGAAQRLVEGALAGRRLRGSFVNAHNLNIAWRDPRYRHLLRQSDLVLGDGVGLQLAARLTGQSLRDNVNGTDLFPILWKRCARLGLKIYLLGGGPGVARAAGLRMERDFATGVFAGARDGFFGAGRVDEVVDSINRSGAELLLVGMGTPAQEFWLADHAARISAPVTVGVGGLFDFYSLRIPRAPLSWRRLGLEWVWRLIQEPGRMWRRYLLGNPAFIYRALLAGAKETER